MKKTMFLVIVFSTVMTIYSQTVPSISELSLEEFVELPEKTDEVMQELYMWNGVISEINESDSFMEIVILKAKWLSTSRLQAYKVLLQIDDPEMQRLVKSIGVYKRISFITKVSSITGDTPVCLPVKIYKF